MSAYYYLVSQLPNISNVGEKSSLPVTEDSFKEICGRFLSVEEQAIVSNLSLIPPRSEESTGSAFLDLWYEKERNLRLALAQIRSQKMKKELVTLPGSCTADIQQVARTALGMDSPLSAEQYLYDWRIKLLDEIKPIDEFSVDAVYAYGIRLMLVSRWRKFDLEKGVESYHKIYDSILGV